MAWLTVFNSLLLAMALPGAGFVLLAFFGRRMDRWGGILATVLAGLSFALAIGALMLWVAKPLFSQPHYVEAYTHPWIILPQMGSTALDAGLASSGAPAVTIGYLVDSLTIALFLLVTLIVLVAHLFTLAWRTGQGDGGFRQVRIRLFARMQLLAFGVLALVLSNSLVQMFACWQVVGIAAFLLVGVERNHLNRRAALDMFIVHRIGDAAFLIGIGILAMHSGRGLSGLAFFDDQGSSILSLTVRQAVGVRSSEFLFFTGDGFFEMHWLTWAGICFLVAVLARCGQFPFQIWRSRVAEAPAAVPALLQAGLLMVSGIYLLVRVYPILTIDTRFIAAILGCITLAVGVLLACVQTDIRKVLVWCSVAQGGMTLLFLGTGGLIAGVLHLFAQTFIMANLFLAAGSVVHCLEGQADLRRMGGLWKRLPITAFSSLFAVLALGGAPWLSGAYTANLGLACVYDYALALQGPAAVSGQFRYEMLLFWIPVVAWYLTAFAIGRWWWLIFAGDNRDPKLLERVHESPLLPVPGLVLLLLCAGYSLEYTGLPALVAKSIPPALMGLAAGTPLVFEGSPGSYAHVLRFAGWSFLGMGLAAVTYMSGFAVADRVRHLPVISGIWYWLREEMFFESFYEGIFVNAVALLSAFVRLLDRLLEGLIKAVAALGQGMVSLTARIEGTSEGPSERIV